MASLDQPDNVTEIRQKAQHLFALCDKEEKGFVSKRDMQRMKNEMPLEPEQLEAVFDSLDLDGNGFLTFDEFIQGFGIYLENDEEFQQVEVADDPAYRSIVEDAEMEDDEHFMKMLDSLGGRSVFEDETSIKNLWDHFRLENPGASLQFETFLERISCSIHNKEREKETMEQFIRNQNEIREEELKRLYEEMEQQIKQEKELIIQTERMKETQLKTELQAEIERRDRQLEELRHRERELQEKVKRLQDNESSNKHELATVLKEKRRLESQLEIQIRNAEDMRSAMERLRRESVNERRQRAMAALSATENVALEREGLVEQLHMLRNINTRLTDENDLRDYAGMSTVTSDAASSVGHELALSTIDSNLPEEDDDVEIDLHPANSSTPLHGNQLSAGGSIKEPFLTGSQASQESRPSLFDELADALESVGPDKTSCLELCTESENSSETAQPVGSAEPAGLLHHSSIVIPLGPDTGRTAKGNTVAEPRSYTAAVHNNRTHGGHIATRVVQALSAVDPTGAKESDWAENRPRVSSDALSLVAVAASSAGNIDSLVGYHSGQWTNRVHLSKREPITPSTVFKIIVLGDSGVGKTSFVRRFCCDDFEGPRRTATVGIDLAVRCLSVGNDKQIALQFWDTAGQERYRSITRQYLRKADGIIIVYDVTSEESFTSVRHWIESVKEVADEEAVTLLVGNKTDLLLSEPILPPSEVQGKEDAANPSGQQPSPDLEAAANRHFSRRVPGNSGMQLAESLGCAFFEASAKTGYMVEQAAVTMAAKLQIRQDCSMEKIIFLASDSSSNDMKISDDGVAQVEKKCCRF